MFVRTLHTKESYEDAQDSLAGQSSLDCFVFGYIEVNNALSSWSVITIWNITEGLLLRGQREILKMVSSPNMERLGLLAKGKEWVDGVGYQDKKEVKGG